MIAEGVPGELAGEAVILVEIVARMREYEIRVRRALRSSKTSFTARALVWQEAVPELVHSTSDEASDRNAVGARPASAARSTGRCENDPGHRDSGRERASASRVPPQPISMSSAWQPTASTRSIGGRRPRASSASISLVRGELWRRVPGNVAALDDRVEILLVLDRVHRRPEPVVAIDDQLPCADEASGLVHDVLARAQIVEDVLPEHEEAAVDADVGLSIGWIALTSPSSPASTTW